MTTTVANRNTHFALAETIRRAILALASESIAGRVRRGNDLRRLAAQLAVCSADPDAGISDIDRAVFHAWFNWSKDVTLPEWCAQYRTLAPALRAISWGRQPKGITLSELKSMVAVLL